MSVENSSLAFKSSRVFTRLSGPWRQDYRPFVAILLVCLAFVVSASWLIFPYFVKGQQLLGDVGSALKQEKLINSISIGKFLSRSSFGVGEAQVDVLYATPKYFEITDQARVVSEFRPDQNIVFFVTETTHIEDLPTRLPVATLVVNGKRYQSEKVEGPLRVYHHRVVNISFPAFDESGSPLLSGNPTSLKLELESNWDPGGGSRIFEWQLPLQYPENLQKTTAWTPLMVLGLSSGLLSFVLTPCLLQLLVVYMMTITGFSAEQHSAGEKKGVGVGTASSHRSKQMILIAIAFVTGFSLLFTLTGAAIGHSGKEAQMFFAVWSPKLSIVAGVLVILMGVWVGIRARAPVVCRLLPAKMMTENTELGGSGSYVGSALTAIGFSLGCLTCFGGAIIATLLVYVGSIGSAFVGATVMFAFSLGIVVPFLLAAFFLSRAIPLLDRLHQYRPLIGLFSMLVIVSFGMVLVTDNFHTLSDFIYPYLGLS